MGNCLVLLNTEHGKELFDSIAYRIVQRASKIEYAIAGNPCIDHSSKQHPKRSQFFANLDKFTIDELIMMYCPYPSLMKRLYYRVRRLLGKFKSSL